MQLAQGSEHDQTPTPSSWRAETGYGPVEPVPFTAVMDDLAGRVASGHLEDFTPILTGFDILDNRTSGGIKPGELVLIAGEPGCGKTTMAFQMARNMASRGQAICLYVCYEHDRQFLLNRLLGDGNRQRRAGRFGGRTHYQADPLHTAGGRARRAACCSMICWTNIQLFAAAARINSYAERLFILEVSSARTTIESIIELVRQHRRNGRNCRLSSSWTTCRRCRWRCRRRPNWSGSRGSWSALKDLAMTSEIPIVAIAAADKGGLMAKRMRPYHLWGGSAVAYEADVIMMMADKWEAVSKLHIEFNVVRAQQYHDWVVCSIEKNRSGKDLVNMEFQKLFAYSCFQPQGATVEEYLIDERIFKE